MHHRYVNAQRMHTWMHNGCILDTGIVNMKQIQECIADVYMNGRQMHIIALQAVASFCIASHCGCLLSCKLLRTNAHYRTASYGNLLHCKPWRLLQGTALQAITNYRAANHFKLLHCKILRLLQAIAFVQASALQAIANIALQNFAAVAGYCSCKLLQTTAH